MSWQALAAVSDRILGSASRKAVVICLANHANIDSELTFPSVFRIAGETELAESTVREALSWLRNKNLIIQVAGPAQHRPATYRLNYNAFSDLQQVEVCRPEVQQVAPDLQQTDSRPPAGGPEQILTVPNHVEEDQIPDIAARAWRAAIIQLEVELPRVIFRTWVRDLKLTSYEDGAFLVRVENDYARDWLTDRLASTVRRVLTGMMGTPAEVRFVVAEQVSA